MTSRERLIAAINHQEPDYVPLDLGSNGQTGMSASTLYRLRKAYGLDEHPIRISEPFQLLGEVEEDLLKKVGADVVPLWNRGNLLGLSNNYTKPWKMTDQTPVWMPDNFEYDLDEKGDTFVYPCGDRCAPYSAHMTNDGFFFDNIDRAPEVDEDDLTPLEDFKDNYTVKTEEDCQYWEKNATRLYENTDYGIMGVLGGMGLGDSAEIPGPFLKNPKGIRKFEDWMMAHLLYPEYVEEIFEYQTEVMLKNLEMYKQAVGDKIQVIWISGTDFGSQNAMIYSKQVFRDMYKPYYKRVNDWVHQNTSWKTFYHSCGAVAELIPEFIDMGVDILNPVQCSAAGMDPHKLKDTYGKDIVFWGGGVDTQKTLPMGTPEEVRKEVLSRLEIFSKGGGYVFTSIHNVVAKVPVENLMAMYDAVREFRGL
ncbi:uroporphyrinogen decarboxylase family protein [Ruminococcus sp. 5_1_39BFAA]|uniref:uroporphyrinogen decarboxylase family protein n=1 Tax=Ruminococcus sp. 5_1_39BFAA TaxID=457412 RepID=UPI003566F085